MNKTSKLFAGFAALALFAACSSDEPMGNNPEGPVTPVEGQKAYLNVKISDAGDAGFGRSTDFATPSYEFGNANEHTVNVARFFFFDAQGNFVTKAQMKPLAGTDAPNDQDNIEYFGENVLVLEDLKSNTYPTYMLTVLNKAEFDVDDTEASHATIGYVCEQLANFAADEASSNFVMSTTSYVGDASDVNHDNTYYSVTKLVEDNFRLTADDAKNTNPVDVYVERLAAKVQVDVTAEKTANGLFKLNQTVAGGDNDEENPDNNTNTTVYLKVLGWGLNATANDSYISKKINTSWGDDNLFANWNNSTRFRSFWGMATTYNLDEAGLDGKLTYTNSTVLNGALKSDDGNYAQYCYENTNTAGNVFKANNADQNLVITQNVTHVVLYTQVCDADGNPVSMISYRGTLFTEDHFKKYVLNALKNQQAGLNYYYQTSATETSATYRQVDVTDIVFNGIEGTVGKVNMALADPAAKLYAKSEVDGKEAYTEIENPDLAQRLTDLQGDPDLFWYNDGANVYYIPIEHNATTDTYGKEGYYGVVRNHWYNLNITKFSRVGHALYDPENGSEILKPEGPEDPLYYVGAKINILSWRVINQGVEL